MLKDALQTLSEAAPLNRYRDLRTAMYVDHMLFVLRVICTDTSSTCMVEADRLLKTLDQIKYQFITGTLAMVSF